MGAGNNFTIDGTKKPITKFPIGKMSKLAEEWDETGGNNNKLITGSLTDISI